ncbi:MAG: hypothetical protein O7H41_12920 [Planctomycetota bacterium]|nr:hypothetical protein [Planctomycetota bacterium]
MVTAEMTTTDERPRVRSGVWLLVIATIGWSVLYWGARRAWFVGALGYPGSSIFRYSFYWYWLLLGGALAVAAGSLWCFVARKSPHYRIVLALASILATMLGGSLWAAQSARGKLFVAIETVRWDHGSQEFVLTVLSPPSVSRAWRNGDLEALVWIRGERTVPVSGEAVRFEGEVTIQLNGRESIFTAEKIQIGESEWTQATLRCRVGDPRGSALIGWNFEAGLSKLVEVKGSLQASKLDYSGPIESYTLRVPWSLVESSTGASIKVRVALASQEGVPIGPMTTTSFRNIPLPLRNEGH